MSECEKENIICEFVQNKIIEAEERLDSGDEKLKYVMKEIHNEALSNDTIKSSAFFPLLFKNPLIMQFAINVIIKILNGFLGNDWLPKIGAKK